MLRTAVCAEAGAAITTKLVPKHRNGPSLFTFGLLPFASAFYPNGHVYTIGAVHLVVISGAKNAGGMITQSLQLHLEQLLRDVVPTSLAAWIHARNVAALQIMNGTLGTKPALAEPWHVLVLH